MSDLNTKLLAAHGAQDHDALVDLYTQAADNAPDIDTACFFLTHAYVFALEQAHPATAQLHARLREHARV